MPIKPISGSPELPFQDRPSKKHPEKKIKGPKAIDEAKQMTFADVFERAIRERNPKQDQDK